MNGFGSGKKSSDARSSLDGLAHVAITSGSARDTWYRVPYHGSTIVAADLCDADTWTTITLSAVSLPSIAEIASGSNS